MSFSLTSRNIYLDVCLDGITLFAECRKRNGIYVAGTINLDSAIANIDGKLQQQKFGSFSFSSSDIQLVGTMLMARCRKVDGEFVNSSLDLDVFIENIDGKLVDVS
ncbi:hypothetical protein HK098_001772 [Nowakowskiella sp. JEL0407]|nr:hypothetical protein HK098_001772 [Nowakowskiella sp. JEL0407]